MKQLNKLLLRSYLGPFVLTFFISMFLLLMQFLWKYIDDLVGKGLDGAIIAELLLYTSASLVPLALPLAVLLSSLMTFGNLGENYELIAIKSSGISLIKIMKPLIAFCIILCIMAFYFSNNLLPIANLKMRTLLYSVRNQRPELNIKPGIFYTGIDKFRIKIASKNTKRNMMYKVMVYGHQSNGGGNTRLTLADSAQMIMTEDENTLIFSLFSGHNYYELEEKERLITEKSFPFQRDTFKTQTIYFDLSAFKFTREKEELFKNNYNMLTLTQIDASVDSLKSEYSTRTNFFIDNFNNTYFFKKERRPPTADSLDFSYMDDVDETNFDLLYANLDDETRKKADDLAINYARSTHQYISAINDELRGRRTWIAKHLIEWHKKFTLSLICLILFFIGAPLGSIIRKGGLGMPAVISVFFFILFYVVDISGQKFAKQSLIPVYQGTWMSSAVLFPIGLFLTIKATTDSTLFNIETYKKMFKVFKIKRP